MSLDWHYRSTIKSRPFLYLETKKVNELILLELSVDNIRRKVVDENILQLKSIARRKEVISIILRRLQVLDTYLMKQIKYNSIDTSKAIVLVAIMMTDRLFYEFIYEVLYEKWRIHDDVLTEAEIERYFEIKATESDSVASWNDYTLYKLKQVYKRILFEAGWIGKSGKHLIINRPLINPDVLFHLEKNKEYSFVYKILGGK